LGAGKAAIELIPFGHPLSDFTSESGNPWLYSTGLRQQMKGSFAANPCPLNAQMATSLRYSCRSRVCPFNWTQ